MLIEIPGRLRGEKHALVLDVDYPPIEVLRVGFRLAVPAGNPLQRVHWLEPHVRVEYDEDELRRAAEARLEAQADRMGEIDR